MFYTNNLNIRSNIRSTQNVTQGVWKCIGAESGTVFSEVDLDEGEWVDYDEKVCHTFNLLYLYLNIWRSRHNQLVSRISKASGREHSNRKSVGLKKCTIM